MTKFSVYIGIDWANDKHHVCVQVANSSARKFDFVTIHPVNTSMLAQYRKAFSPSGAKDDPTDAELALDLMLRYPTIKLKH